ncbi:MAG: DUF4097 family beta strand repeat-containing protein [Candidatus Lokiarchaeota archaeon]
MKTKRAGLLIVVLMALSVVACAQSRMEKTLPLQPGGEFVLQSDAGSVTVTGSSASGARIVITSNREDIQSLFNFNFESSDGVVRVTARKKSFFSWFSNINLHFDVTVPDRTRVSVKTGGGTIRVSSLQGEQNLNTSGGSIVASDVHGNVVARTSGGSITANSVDGSLDANTSGGSIHIDGLTGHVSAHTSGGSIHATFARGNSQGGELKTSGGSIRASVDPKANLNIDASTSGGSVSSDLPLRVQGTISHSSVHGTLGSGGPTLLLHTSGGSIHISSN